MCASHRSSLSFYWKNHDRWHGVYTQGQPFTLETGRPGHGQHVWRRRVDSGNPPGPVPGAGVLFMVPPPLCSWHSRPCCDRAGKTRPQGSSRSFLEEQVTCVLTLQIAARAGCHSDGIQGSPCMQVLRVLSDKHEPPDRTGWRCHPPCPTVHLGPAPHPAPQTDF